MKAAMPMESRDVDEPEILRTIIPELPDNMPAFLDKAQGQISERVRKQLRGIHINVANNEVSGKSLRAKKERDHVDMTIGEDLNEVIRLNKELFDKPGSSEITGYPLPQSGLGGTESEFEDERF